jgi:hypothetical protein
MKNIKDLIFEIQEYDFKLEFKRERYSLIKIKFLAFHHLQSGKLLKDVADIVLYDEKAGRGQRPRLPREKEEEFRDELDKLYEKRKGGRIKVDDIQKLLLDKFDCNYSH